MFQTAPMTKKVNQVVSDPYSLGRTRTRVGKTFRIGNLRKRIGLRLLISSMSCYLLGSCGELWLEQQIVEGYQNVMFTHLGFLVFVTFCASLPGFPDD